MPSLAISEIFYSIQGEGPSIGKPSLFIRLKGCNLSCGGPDFVKTRKKSKNATWSCDTIDIWTKGKTESIETIIKKLEKNKWLTLLKQNTTLIITGGEPLQQQKGLISLCQTLQNKLKKKIYIEIETNGTLLPQTELDHFISQYNVSPKLKNSGLNKEVRIKKECINYFKKNKKSIFKFVLNSAKEKNLLFNEFINPFKIKAKKIFIMPACQSKEKCLQKQEELINFCKDYQFNYSTRLHILVYNNQKGK